MLASRSPSANETNIALDSVAELLRGCLATGEPGSKPEQPDQSSGIHRHLCRTVVSGADWRLGRNAGGCVRRPAATESLSQADHMLAFAAGWWKSTHASRALNLLELALALSGGMELDLPYGKRPISVNCPWKGT